MLMLLWLTVSSPFVTASQQKMAEKQKVAQQSGKHTDNETAGWNAVADNTEERTETGNTGFSEYLHEITELVRPATSDLQQHHGHATPLYIAFHGELLSPPPEA